MLGEFCWLARAMTGVVWVSWGSPCSGVPSRTVKAEVSIDQSCSWALHAVDALAEHLRLKWTQARVFQGFLHIWSPSRVAEAEMQGGLGSPWASCAEGALGG